jgi:polyhydroxybutyrate depolymerase
MLSVRLVIGIAAVVLAACATSGDELAIPDASRLSADAASVDAPTATAPDAAPITCGAAEWTPGTHETVTLAHDGLQRSYVIYVGDAVPPGVPAPLVVNFHGLNNSPSIQESFSRMNDLADVEGFVVAYPQGISSSFNAGGCCGTAASQGVDDVGFARAIVDDVAARTCIDRRRVYATGFSNGGFMSHRLACEASDLFAAFAPVSGANAMTPCSPSRAIPVIAFHGDADTIVSYSSGTASIAAWVAYNHCDSTPTRTAHGDSYCDRWTGCDDGALVELCTIAGGWHLWPGASSDHAATPAIWSFLRTFTLPD